MKKRKKLDKWFLLTWKKMLIIVVGWFLAVVLHNLVYAIFKTYFDAKMGGDEPFFFIIVAVVIPIYFLISFIYTTIKMIKDKSIFEKEFIIRVLIAIILGALASYVLVLTTFINPEMGFMLTVIFIIFTFIFYYVIKSFKN